METTLSLGVHPWAPLCEAWVQTPLEGLQASKGHNIPGLLLAWLLAAKKQPTGHKSHTSIRLHREHPHPKKHLLVFGVAGTKNCKPWPRGRLCMGNGCAPRPKKLEGLKERWLTNRRSLARSQCSQHLPQKPANAAILQGGLLRTRRAQQASVCAHARASLVSSPPPPRG